mmetsp:Transcript_125452/g.366431  ORF Transcript_125452/g.366431 Transcript_125452/m.366431 type:complete len:323 (+) Transcript_125452:663-1631(+)
MAEEPKRSTELSDALAAAASGALSGPQRQPRLAEGGSACLGPRLAQHAEGDDDEDQDQEADGRPDQKIVLEVCEQDKVAPAKADEDARRLGNVEHRQGAAALLGLGIHAIRSHGGGGAHKGVEQGSDEDAEIQEAVGERIRNVAPQADKNEEEATEEVAAQRQHHHGLAAPRVDEHHAEERVGEHLSDAVQRVDSPSQCSALCHGDGLVEAVGGARPVVVTTWQRLAGAIVVHGSNRTCPTLRRSRRVALDERAVERAREIQLRPLRAPEEEGDHQAGPHTYRRRSHTCGRPVQGAFLIRPPVRRHSFALRCGTSKAAWLET